MSDVLRIHWKYIMQLHRRLNRAQIRCCRLNTHLIQTYCRTLLYVIRLRKDHIILHLLACICRRRSQPLPGGSCLYIISSRGSFQISSSHQSFMTVEICADTLKRKFVYAYSCTHMWVSIKQHRSSALCNGYQGNMSGETWQRIRSFLF